MQVDGELAKGARQYRGMFHAGSSIAMREGVRGLWAGIIPGIMFQVGSNCTAVYFACTILCSWCLLLIAVMVSRSA